MKVIYMPQTLILLSTKMKAPDFEALLTSGELKELDEKMYLVINTEE